MSVYLKKYTNKHSRFAVVDDSLLHYRDEGKGHPILLLHGAFSSLHTFDYWTEILTDNGFRVLRFDLPGFGLTGSRSDHQYSMEIYVNTVFHFLDIMGLDKVSIAGNSLGGWLAWEFALKYPNHVDNLILIAAAGFIDDRSIPLPFKMAKTPFINKVIKYVVKRSVLEQFVKEVYGDPSKVTEELVDRYFHLFSREGNPEAFLAICNTKPKDNTPKLKKIKHETLIIWGEKDNWIPIEYAYRFDIEIPKTELVIYEGVGHIPMEEIPEETAAELISFLSRKSSSIKASMRVSKSA
ncbi:MAG: alpha/beta hydrolase [Bacteroidota bacterium]